MAPTPTDQDRKAQLVADLAASRQTLRRDRLHIGSQLNPVLRLRTAIREKPVPVFAAAAGTAFLLSVLLRRRPREEKRRGATRWLLGGALALAKPAARVWLTNLARTHAPTLFQTPDSDHTP